MLFLEILIYGWFSTYICMFNLVWPIQNSSFS